MSCRRLNSFGSRVDVRAIRHGMPNISAKQSQNVIACFLGMVWSAAFSSNPRSSGRPASISQSRQGRSRNSMPVSQFMPTRCTTRPFSGITCLRGMSDTPEKAGWPSPSVMTSPSSMSEWPYHIDSRQSRHKSLNQDWSNRCFAASSWSPFSFTSLKERDITNPTRCCMQPERCESVMASR